MAIENFVGNRIKAFRKRKGLSQQELADKICKGKGSVSKYESGNICIDIRTIYDIASALEIPISALVCDDLSGELFSPGPFVARDGTSSLYMYTLRTRDKRKTRLIESRIFFSPLDYTDPTQKKCKAVWYEGLEDAKDLSSSRAIIEGDMDSYETYSLFTFINHKRQHYRTTIYYMNMFNNNQITDGLIMTFATMPPVPIAVRCIFSKKPIEDREALIKNLLLTNADISEIKRYNGLTVKLESGKSI